MKYYITLLLFGLFIGLSAQSNSRTHELVPVFHMKNLEYISDVEVFKPSVDMSFVGISCYHFDAIYKDISYRYKHQDEWSSWKTFSPQHELTGKIRTAYEGDFITSKFTALQFKTTDVLESELTVRLFTGMQSSTSIFSLQKSLLCGPVDACDRSCWCSSCPIDMSPQLTEPTHIIVHHSAGSNLPQSNYAEVVSYIWDLHTNTNGWDDIGYNWLIDPNGVLYEGRPDGYQGAHFSCINENTIGICLLGDFTQTSPKDEAVNTLVNLIAFEATDHDIDVLSQSYHETGEFILSNVAGHRDSSESANGCSSTVCPGDSFYPMLDSIRIKVSELNCYQDNISSSFILDKLSWSISPNPFKHTLIVDNNDYSLLALEIKDINGRSCGKLFSGQKHDLSYLSQGIYFVVFDNGVIGKVVKR